MPITSTEISQILSGQMNTFGQSQAYSQQLAMSMGTSPQQQVGSFGGNGGLAYDPRTPGAANLAIGGQLGMAGVQAGIGAANVGMGALSFAADWGMAPAIFSPFMGSLKAATSAFGGAPAGMGIARGLGAGMAAGAGYLALGGAFNAMTNQMLQGAQEQLEVNTMLSMNATRRALPMMGGMNMGDAGQIGGMMRNMAQSDAWTSMSELNGIMGQGLQAGMFRGAGDIGQFQGKFRELIANVRQVATALHTSMGEAMPVLQQVQGMGFYGGGAAAGATQAMAAIAGGIGTTSGAVMGAAAQGAGIARQYGVHGSIGAGATVGLMGRLGAAQMGGFVSGDALREMAGGAPLDQAMPAIAGQLTQAAMQAAIGNKSVMAALIDPNTGHIDTARATAYSMGAISSSQIKQMAHSNMYGSQGRSVREAMQARSHSLAGEMLGSIGAEGILGGYARGEMQSRGLKPGESGSDVSDILLAKFSGLGEQQAQLISQMTQSGPGIKAQLQQQMQQELQASKAEMAATHNTSWEGIKRRLVHKYVDPLANPLRRFGAEMSTWAGEAFSGAIDWLMGDEGGGSQAPLMATAGSSQLGMSLLTGDRKGMRYGSLGGGIERMNQQFGANSSGFTMPGGVGADFAVGGIGLGMNMGGRALTSISSKLLSGMAMPTSLSGLGSVAKRGLGGELSGGLGMAGRVLGRGLMIGAAADMASSAISLASDINSSLGFTTDYTGAMSQEQGDYYESLYRSNPQKYSGVMGYAGTHRAHTNMYGQGVGGAIAERGWTLARTSSNMGREMPDLADSIGQKGVWRGAGSWFSDKMSRIGEAYGEDESPFAVQNRFRAAQMVAAQSALTRPNEYLAGVLGGGANGQAMLRSLDAMSRDVSISGAVAYAGMGSSDSVSTVNKQVDAIYRGSSGELRAQIKNLKESGDNVGLSALAQRVGSAEGRKALLLAARDGVKGVDLANITNAKASELLLARIKEASPNADEGDLKAVASAFYRASTGTGALSEALMASATEQEHAKGMSTLDRWKYLEANRNNLGAAYKNAVSSNAYGLGDLTERQEYLLRNQFSYNATLADKMALAQAPSVRALRQQFSTTGYAESAEADSLLSGNKALAFGGLVGDQARLAFYQGEKMIANSLMATAHAAGAGVDRGAASAEEVQGALGVITSTYLDMGNTKEGRRRRQYALGYLGPVAAATAARSGEVQEALLYGRGGKARGFAGMIANLSHGDEFMSAEISRGMVHNFNTHQGMSARQLEAVQHILQRQGVPEGRQGEIMNAAQGYSRSGAASDANKLADLLGRTEGAIALRPGAGKVAAGDVVQQLIEGLGPIVKDLKDVKLRGGDPGPWSMTNTGGR